MPGMSTLLRMRSMCSGIVSARASACSPEAASSTRALVTAERLANQAAHHRIILDQQDQLRAHRRALSRQRTRGHGQRQRFIRGRKIQREGGPVSGFALHFDVAPDLLDDAVHGRQAETGAFPESLRREERFEEVRPRVRIHSAARVANDQRHVGTGRDGRVDARFGTGEPLHRRFNHQRAPARHRVSRVEGEVQERVFELDGIPPDGSNLGAELSVDFDVLTEDPAEDLLDLTDDAVEIDAGDPQRLFAAEGEVAE